MSAQNATEHSGRLTPELRQQLEISKKTARRRHPLQPKNWSLGSNRARFEHLRPYLADRLVLDLGCAVGYHRPDWLHGMVREVAAEATAVDIDAQAVEAIAALGYDIAEGNAETVRLGRTYDVVLAGEMIEHLNNFAGLLDTAAAHLAPGGRLVITTPNAMCFTNFLYRIGGKPRVNEDHTCWFCEDTLTTLFTRNGWKVAELRYLDHATPGRLRGLVARGARRMLPDRLAWGTILAVAEPPAQN